MAPAQELGKTLPMNISDAPTEIGGDESEAIQITDTRVQSGAPRKFGNFELLGELGHGGMGVVYKARQINPDRMVALKMILTGSFAAAGFRRRFEIEAEAVGNLRHPNIVSLYESGELGGNLYYTMPLIEGCTLADSVEEDQWSVRESVELMKKLADAIAHAHQRGVLHRDLKPSNILLDKQREPFITDFGLAKITDSDTSADVTMTGDVMGSPGYMAPEQAMGRTHEISTATDVYGLGVIMYQVVTGHPPFRGETVAELLQHVIHTEPARPKSALGRIDRDLSTICLRCMEKDPKARYATAAELAADLQRWLDGEPIKARAVSMPERTWKWMRRNPLMTTFLLVTVVLSSVAVIGIESQRRLYRDQRSKYLEQLLDAKMRHAETELEKGYPGKALAHFASILSIDPKHRVARSRIAEQLANGVFSRALHRPIDTGIEIKSTHRQLGISSDWQKIFLVHDRETPDEGSGWLINDDQLAKLELGRELRYMGFSPDKEWLFVSQPSDGVRVRDTKTMESLFTLPTTNEHVLTTIHPEKTQIATVGRAYGPRLWNPTNQTYRELTWSEPANSLRGFLRYDSTGRWLVARAGKQFTMWDSRSGELHLEHIESREAGCYAFSPDGQLFGWGGSKNLARIWNIASKEVIAELDVGAVFTKFSKALITSMCFNHDGQLVATGGRDKRVVVWESNGGKIVNEFRHDDELTHVVFDSTGRFLLTASKDKTMRVWDVEADRAHSEWIYLTEKIRAAGFSSGSETITAVCEDGSIHRLSIVQPNKSFKFGRYSRQVDFSPTGDELVVAAWDGTKSTDSGAFHGKPNGPLNLKFPHRLFTTKAEFSPDGNHIGVRGYKQEVSVWKRRADGVWSDDRRWVKVDWTHPLAAFSHDGQMLLIADKRKDGAKILSRFRLWSLEETGTGGELAPIRTDYPLDRYSVHALAFHPDNQHFAIGGLYSVKLWSIDGTNPVVEFQDGREPKWLEFSPNGRYLAGGLAEGKGMVWNVATGKRQGPHLVHHGSVNRIRFSPNGQLVVTGSDDKTAQVWRVSDCQPVGTPVEHRGEILDLAISPAGDRFATASADGTARVWDLETGQPLTAPLVHHHPVSSLDFNHDGSLLATSAANGDVRIWSMKHPEPERSAEELIKLAEELGRHRLTEDGRVVRIPW